MDDPLNKTKKTLRAKHSKDFTSCGVHALGVRRSESAICIYVHDADEAQQEALLQEMRDECKPFELKVIKEDAPTIH